MIENFKQYSCDNCSAKTKFLGVIWPEGWFGIYNSRDFNKQFCSKKCIKEYLEKDFSSESKEILDINYKGSERIE